MSIQKQINTHTLDSIIHVLFVNYDSNITNIICEYKEDLEEKEDIYSIHEVGFDITVAMNNYYIQNIELSLKHQLLATIPLSDKCEPDQPHGDFYSVRYMLHRELIDILRKYIKKGYILYENNDPLPKYITYRLNDRHDTQMRHCQVFKLFAETLDSMITFHYYTYYIDTKMFLKTFKTLEEAKTFQSYYIELRDLFKF